MGDEIDMRLPPVDTSDLSTRAVRVRVHVNDDSQGKRRYLPGGVELVLDDGTTINVSEATVNGSFTVHGSSDEAVKTGIQFFGAIEYVEHQIEYR